MVGLAPRALRDCAPSALWGVVVRPLNFTVRGRNENPRKGSRNFRDPRPTLRLTFPLVRAWAGGEAITSADVGGSALWRLCIRLAFVVRCDSQLRFALKIPRAHSRLVGASSNQRWNGP